MTATSFEHADEARAALRAIVSDPAHGANALHSAQLMSNLLNDFLPDAPREKSLLVAAAEAELASALREHVAQGMDASTAIRLTASSFAARTAFGPDACHWVAAELAVALGLAAASPAATRPFPTAPWEPRARAGVQAEPAAAQQPVQTLRAYPAGDHPASTRQGQYPPGQYPPAGYPQSGPRPQPQLQPHGRPHPQPHLPYQPHPQPPARGSRRGVLVGILMAGVILVGVVIVVLRGAAGEATSPGSIASIGLTRRTPPGGGYRVLLPASWKFRDVSYPSDHSTHLWHDPMDPLRKMQVVLSGCAGCAEHGLNPRQPDPARLVPAGAVSQSAVSRWEVRFKVLRTSDRLPDYGEVIVLHRGGVVRGYIVVELWLPAIQRARADVILRSFTPAGS